MRVLAAFILFLFCCCTMAEHRNDQFIVFTNDGTFYKLNPNTREVDWYSTLPFKLLTVDISGKQDNETKKLFIPTIDGDFLYLQKSVYEPEAKQILVPREDLQSLLDICFDSDPNEKYFVYEKLEHFVLNTIDGSVSNLQQFFSKNQQSLNKNTHSILTISRKLLKQLNANNMNIKWSVISSKINLIDISRFLQYPKYREESQVYHNRFEFIRKNTRNIEIYDEKSVVFEIETSSPILSIFASVGNEIFKVKIKNGFLNAMLALEDKNEVQVGEQMKFDNFPTSQAAAEKQNKLSLLQMCIKTQRIIKKDNSFQQLGEFHKIFALPTLPFSRDERIKVIVTKQQPYVLIFLIIILMGMAFSFYRFKINKLWNQMTLRENENDEKLRRITEKLGEYENVGKQVKKMYEINWDRVVYQSQNYLIFQGRFLNQKAEVYVIKLTGSDIIDIQHKLNLLINCSHRKIFKLYYYTRNEDCLLIFSETAEEYKKLSDVDQKQIKRLFGDKQILRDNIMGFLDCVSYLYNFKIELHALVNDSVEISEDHILKINIIPSLLTKPDEERELLLEKRGTTLLRLNLVEIMYRIGHGGAEFDFQKFEKQKNTEDETNFFLKDFYDYVLTFHQISNNQTLKNMEQISNHPYLWNSKQKMLYISDYSNYLETCIDEFKISKMEARCRKLAIIKYPWIKELHPLLVNILDIQSKQVSNYRKYDYQSVRDLIRLIRNKLNHFHEIPKETRNVVGKTPQLLAESMLKAFPKLLPFMYVYAIKKKWKLNTH